MADELCLPGYLTHNWGKIVEVSGSYPHAGGPAHNNSGGLAPPRSTAVRPDSNALPVFVVCRGKALQQSCR